MNEIVTIEPCVASDQMTISVRSGNDYVRTTLASYLELRIAVRIALERFHAEMGFRRMSGWFKDTEQFPGGGAALKGHLK